MPWTTPRPTEKTSTLLLKTPSQIDPRNVPRALAIPTVPICLAKPETVNSDSGVLGGGRNKTQNLLRTTLSLVEGVVRVKSLKRAVGVVKRLLQSDLGRARGLLQRPGGKIVLRLVLDMTHVQRNDPLDFTRQSGPSCIPVSHNAEM